MSLATILPDSEYKTWTDNWKAVVKPGVPLPFFTHDGQAQTGVVFHFDSLRYLFSTPGLVTIKVRFGLRKVGEELSWEFHPILFGVNSRDEIVTPYFISSSFTHHHHYPKQVENEGNLPQELMRLWKKSWHDNVLEKAVTGSMFLLNGGVLQGYNYVRKEVMDAVGSFPGISHVHIKFGLHKYYSMQPTAALEPTFQHTFGLILYAGIHTLANPGHGQLADSAGQAPLDKPAAGPGFDEDESGFYDFTAPCPYTC